MLWILSPRKKAQLLVHAFNFFLEDCLLEGVLDLGGRFFLHFFILLLIGHDGHAEVVSIPVVIGDLLVGGLLILNCQFVLDGCGVRN